ncbi:MAG: diguanylate cyclase [Dehalococcoidia bacterium]|nr:diguanylate cyclase [Dehalococcoidia bacterium]
MPRVPDSQRRAFEEAAGNVIPAFQIDELDSYRHVVRADGRSEYYPLLASEGATPVGEGLGFDFATDPSYWEAMKQARDTGEPAATGRMVLRCSTEGAFGYVVFVPIFRPDAVNGTPSDRAGSLIGFAAAAVSIGGQVNMALPPQLKKGVTLRFDDKYAPPSGQYLYTYNRAETAGTGPAGRESAAGLISSETMTVGGRQWNVLGTASPEYLTGYDELQPWLLLSGGLLFSALLGFFFVSNIMRVSKTEGMIRDRTASLVNEIEERRRAEEAVQETNIKLTTWVDGLQRRTAEISLLSEMSELLQSTMTADEAYSIASHFGERLFPDGDGGLYALPPSRNALEMVSAWGKNPPVERLFVPDACWALRRGRLYAMADLRSGPVCSHVGEFPPGGYLCVPMISQTNSLGLLNLEFKTPPGGSEDFGAEHLGEDARRLAVALADQVAMTLANLNLRESLRQQAIRDPLTGLFNRRFMEESLDLELRRAQRKGSSLVVIMLDVDHFKLLNDTHGHEAGDVALQALGGFLLTSIRDGDIACRYGGEEFMLMLPEVTLDVAVERALALKDGIQQLPLRYERGSMGPLTVSLGLAAFPDHGATVEAVMRAADTALYRAKQEGRNRVVVFSAGGPGEPRE